MYVKVCGLRTEADVACAAEAGADAVGFVLSESPRQVDPDVVRALVAATPEPVLTVAVLGGVPVAEAKRLALATGVAAVQLHGRYPRSAFDAFAGLPVRLIRATAVEPDTDLSTGAYGEEMLLLDSRVAGSGHRWDLAVLDGVRPRGRWLLAGGLAPANVAEAITAARPWGVDVSSGVESRRGVKDHGLIRDFLAGVAAAGPSAGEPGPPMASAG
ncbi:phosphoribosylanthranilate isomerase [Plantactinospora sp. KBS50]|uniref:phosphoribosylanthranilate isomerase n=1 Tax=Plantactinospora sp. KBS50 TaxID=2024580 RepID=UPI000BAACBDD|nr:phosphoribosylanthranilate isomerase [Plantactinospora sp. KBS50]ASW53767.1 phosphoribosylanthranilate isomerase [Plantactinospora sp. KBS50]